MKNFEPELPPATTININGVDLTLYIVEDGLWLLTDEQVAKAYGRAVNTIRRHVQRNKDVLIEGRDWFMKSKNCLLPIPASVYGQ